jgi:hypothetical protein
MRTIPTASASPAAPPIVARPRSRSSATFPALPAERLHFFLVRSYQKIDWLRDYRGPELLGVMDVPPQQLGRP